MFGFSTKQFVFNSEKIGFGRVCVLWTQSCLVTLPMLRQGLVFGPFLSSSSSSSSSSANTSHFLFQLQHCWSDFNQTWSECCPGQWLPSLCFLGGSRFAFGGSRCFGSFLKKVSWSTSFIGFRPNLVRMLPWWLAIQLVLFGWFPFCLRWFPASLSFLAPLLKMFPGPHG